MKCIAVFVACFALASALPAKSSPKDLASSVDELLGIVNFNGWLALVQDQVANDADMQNLVALMGGPEYIAMIEQVLENEDWLAFVLYCSDHGLNIYDYLKPFADILGWPLPAKRAASKSFADLIATWSEFFAGTGEPALSWILTNIESNPDVQDFIVYVQSQSFQDLIQYIRTQDATQALAAALEADGLDVTGTFALIIEFLGWDLPPY